MTEQKGYRQILKSTSLFGGVQVINVVVTIIRSKLVAVLLGPNGIAIMGLFTSTLGVIGGATNFGLGISAVKDVAAANGRGDKSRISLVVAVFRKLVWITGLLGMCITLFLSSFLSNLTFGNNNYTVSFVILSVTLLLNQLNSGQRVLLQGMRQTNYLAKAGVLGSVIGLFVSIPLFYLFGLDGIVPSLLTTTISTVLLTWYYSGKIYIEDVRVTIRQVFREGSGMLKIGFLLSLNGLLVSFASYALRLFISRIGSVEDVGLYTAGFAIMNTYVGMVFTAMSTDFYPRLSALAHDISQMRQAIIQQVEVAVLIVGPILVGFLVFNKWIIYLLYSNKFLSVEVMLHWAALGIFFKAVSWAISITFMAKGNSKVLFWSELSANIYMLIGNLIGYYWGALTGLGISFLVGYLLYLIQVYVVSVRLYNFSFSISFIKIFTLQFSFALVAFLIVSLTGTIFSYVVGGGILILSAVFSVFELEKRIGIIDLMKRRLSRK